MSLLKIQKYKNKLSTVKTSLLLIFFILISTLILPISSKALIDTKLLFLFILTLTTLLFFAIKTWQRKTVSFIISPFSIPLLVFGLATLVSSIFSGKYPAEHLLGVGGAYLSMVILGLFAINNIDKEKIKKWFSITIALTGIILTSLLAIKTLNIGPSYILNLTGSSLINGQLLFIFFIGLITKLIKKDKTQLIEKISIITIAGGLLLAGWTMRPGQAEAPLLLPHTASWAISVDTFKSTKTSLIGFGPDNFSNAYNIFKPHWINSTQLWNTKFSVGSNAPFTIIVTIGLLGIIGWLLIFFTLIKETKHINRHSKTVHYMLLTSFVLQLVLPISISIIAIQSILISLWIILENDRFGVLEVNGFSINKIKSQEETSHTKKRKNWFVYLFISLIILLVISISYLLGRAYLANFLTARSLVAARKNDTIKVYQLQQRAVSLNPYSDEFRRQYAITNLAIATALAQKTDRTQQENQDFSELIKQSIREGKAATIIDPANTENWVNLAQIYRSLIGVADSSAQWAVNSYITAIQTNPLNPTLHVELGGILYGAKNYPKAADLFKQAIEIKPDYANAYYSLANSLSQTGQLEAAKIIYQKTLQLTSPDSNNYIKAAEELEKIEKLITKPSETLN